MSNMVLAAGNKKIIATLDLPGSKSIANRVLPLAAFADGVSIIHNVPDVGEDVQLMVAQVIKFMVVVANYLLLQLNYF